MKKRISSVLLCLALLLSVVPTSVLAADSEIEIYTCAMLSKDHSAAAEEWKTFWGEADMDPTDLYVMLSTSPAISNKGNATVLTFELPVPELDGWRCVGYYYYLDNENGEAVTLNGTEREIDWKNDDYFEDICIYKNVSEQAENIQLSYTGTTSLGYVEFYYLMAPADQKSTASLTFENVFDGAEDDHGYNEWMSSAKMIADGKLSNMSAVYTDNDWTIPSVDSFNSYENVYEYWQITKCEVIFDNRESETVDTDTMTVSIPEDTESVKVTYYWRVAGVTNVIEPLERVVKQNEAELAPKTGSTPDTYVIAGKENVTVDYTATMDMSKLDSGRYAAGSWDTLKNRWNLITDATVVYLNFTFDDNIILSAEDFQKAVLTSDMFTFNGAAEGAVSIEENTVKLTCHWDGQKAAQNMESKSTLDPIITLNGVTLKIEDTWTGDVLTLKNEGNVTGYVHTTLESDGLYGAIYGGYQSDKFVLTTQVTLSYDANGGAGSMESQNGTVGTDVTVAENGFTYDGYTFTGWNTAPDGSGTAYKAGDTFTLPAADTVLYAQWSKNYIPPKPVKPSEPTEPSNPPILNTEDHYAYIIGYPVDYYTGEPTDDQTRMPVKPEGNITRAEVATIFFRLLTDEARDEYWSQTSSYSDVELDDWFNNAVCTLSNAGLISGYPDGTFRPNSNITRAEFATIASRFFEYADETYQNPFSDVDEGAWYYNYVMAASAMGLINGYPDGTFGPQKDITRAEAVTIVNRTLDRHPDPDHLLDDMLVWPDNMDTTKWYYADMQEATNSHEYEMQTSSDSKYEIWTQLLLNRDWKALEKAWSDANSAPGGEVMR